MYDLQLSKQSFPLCMRHLHETLRSTHHLKHGGRMQYGLFVKGIGLSLENSLKFWREEFSKNMDMDKVGKPPPRIKVSSKLLLTFPYFL